MYILVLQKYIITLDNFKPWNGFKYFSGTVNHLRKKRRVFGRQKKSSESITLHEYHVTLNNICLLP